MNAIILNEKNNTIEMTKKFAAAAKRYGTDAYKQLQEVRRDYPTFRVIIKSASGKKRDSFKGLTYAYMEDYIKAHDDDDGSKLAAFNDLRATSETAKAFGAEAMSYGEIKAWFFQQYPAFAKFQKKRKELLTKAAD